MSDSTKSPVSLNDARGRQMAEEASRKLFKELSDTFSLSGHVRGYSRDLVPVFADALELAFERGIGEGIRRVGLELGLTTAKARGETSLAQAEAEDA
jgi:hypothetical protein